MPEPTAKIHPRLTRMIERASRNIEQIFAVVGSVAAMWHYVKSDGDEVVMLAPLNLSKDDTVAIVRQVLADEDAVAVLFMDEAWSFVTSDPQEAAAWLASGRNASTHPRRREVVHFQAEDNTGALIAVREIVRTPGQPPTLGPLVVEECDQAAGRLVGMLPRRKVTLQ
jgi:hypothetical protein